MKLSADELLAQAPKSFRGGVRSWFHKLSPEHQALVEDMAVKSRSRGVAASAVCALLKQHGICEISSDTWNQFVRARLAEG